MAQISLYRWNSHPVCWKLISLEKFSWCTTMDTLFPALVWCLTWKMEMEIETNHTKWLRLVMQLIWDTLSSIEHTWLGTYSLAHIIMCNNMAVPHFQPKIENWKLKIYKLLWLMQWHIENQLKCAHCINIHNYNRRRKHQNCQQMFQRANGEVKSLHLKENEKTNELIDSTNEICECE